ncbi:hypothetical protein M879_19485 [Mycobacteroides abscessus V06705]|nr:hypothetical protein M879_19485 [Mycobacteroides abscessus V06705]
MIVFELDPGWQYAQQVVLGVELLVAVQDLLILSTSEMSLCCGIFIQPAFHSQCGSGL